MSRELIAEFCVEGEPVSKSRARFTKRGSKTMAYTPERTKEAEAKVAWAFRQVARGHVPDATHAYMVDAAFFTGTRQRRDVDNMVKLICDGLNGVAWADDNQVTQIAARKMMTERRDQACTMVRVYQLNEVDYPTRDCLRCGTAFRTYPSLPNSNHCGQECFLADKRDRRLRTCEQCGTTFDSGNNSKARFCGRKCSVESRRTTVACAHCGQDFTMQNCHVRERNYCSPKCQQASMRPIRAANARGICATCGGPTSKKQYTNCRGCDFASKSARGNPKPTIEEIT